jgi:hypothetical protein
VRSTLRAKQRLGLLNHGWDVVCRSQEARIALIARLLWIKMQRHEIGGAAATLQDR